MALRINPVTGLQEQVKEDVASAAKLQEAQAAKTAVEKLVDDSELPSMRMQPAETSNIAQLSQIGQMPRGAGTPPGTFPVSNRREEANIEKARFQSFLAEEQAKKQAEIERIPALSELYPEIVRKQDRIFNGDYSKASKGDAYGKAIERADDFAKAYLGTSDKVRVRGSSFTPTVTQEMFQEVEGLGVIPTADALGRAIEGEDPAFKDRITEGAGGLGRFGINTILLDPDGFNAGTVQNPKALQSAGMKIPDDGRLRTVIDPSFARIMGLVTERFIFNNQYASNESPESKAEDGDVFASTRDEGYMSQLMQEREGVDVESDGTIRRAAGNLQLGREIYRNWKREQNKMMGVPTDQFSENNVTSNDFEVIGGFAKQLYAELNPNLYKKVNLGTVDPSTGITAVGYQLTPLGKSTLREAADSAPDAFAAYEIPPLNAPESVLAGTTTGLGESKRMRKQKTTFLVNRKMEKIELAKANMSRIEHVVDPLKRKIVTQMGLELLTGLKAGQNIPKIGNFFRTGPEKAATFVGEKARKVRNQEEGAEEYNPKYEFQKQVIRFIEDLNTMGKYSNKSNHLTFAVQELQSRMHATQTRFNPQLKPLIRFVTSGARPSTVTPGQNTPATRAFKELMTVHFMSSEAKRALPETRIAMFDREWAQPDHGIFKQVIQEGRDIAESLMSPEQDKQFTDLLKDIKLANVDVQSQNIQGSPDTVANFTRQFDAGQQSVPAVRVNPALMNTPKLNISNRLMNHAVKDDLEALRLVEAAHELYRYDRIEKNNDATSFTSHMNAEIDGITHGPASNLMVLGIISAAYRTGVLRRPGALKNLDTFTVSDVAKLNPKYAEQGRTEDQIAGDIRQAMAEYMRQNGDIHAANFLRDDIVTTELFDMLMLATKDPEFLKKPPMTLAYGQLMKNLVGQVKDTISTGPMAREIQKIINKPEVKKALEKKGFKNQTPEDVAATFLHNVLADSIMHELDPAVIQVGQLLRANAGISALTNDVIEVKNAIGIPNYIGGRQTYMSDVATGGVIEDPKTGKSVGSPIPLYESIAEGSAEREGPSGATPGGYARSQIIPSVIQGIDGAWMNAMFTDSFASLGNGRTYMLPIMDAVVTSLDGLEKVRAEANKNWFNVIKNYSYVDSIMGEWSPKTISKFRNKLKRLGDQEIETKNTGYRMFPFLTSVPANGLSADPVEGVSPLVAFLNDTMRLPDKPIVLKGRDTKGKSVAAYEKSKRFDALAAAESIMKELQKSIKFTEVNDGITVLKSKHKANDILKMFDTIIGPKGLDIERRNREEVKNVAENKAALIKAAMDSAQFQIDIG